MKRKMALVVLIIIALALTGALAFAGGTQESDTKAAQSSDVTLKIYARAYTFEQDDPWNYAEKELQARHPELNITFVEEGFGWSDLRTKFLTSAAGGEAPDVVQSDIIWLGEYVEGGLLTDLTDKVNQWSEWPDVVQSFKEATMWDGKVYGTWLNTDVRVMVYNKKLFRAAGLDPDKPPTDWDELYDMAMQISNPPAYYGFGFPGMLVEATAHRYFAFLYSAGGQILSDDMQKAAFNSEEGVYALETLEKMMNDGATPTSVVSGTYGDIDNAVFQDKFAISFMTKPFGLAKKIIPGLTPEQFREDFGVAPIPMAPGGDPSTMSGGYLLTVPTGSEHPDLAWELASLAGSAEAQFGYTTARGYVPTFYSLMARSEDYYSIDPFFSVILDQLPTAHFRPSIPQYTEISAAIQYAIQATLLGAMDAEAALDQAAEIVNQLLAE